MSYERKQRGITQNIYLIETIINDNNFERKYVVMGSTGNVYDVTIKANPTCTCPDYMSRNKRCKHVYFILVKVMKTVDEDKLEYSTDDLEYMFSNIPAITKNLVVDNHLRDEYMKLKQSENVEMVEQKDTNDLCPICLDDLENGEEIDYCKYSCGKGIHLGCFAMWTKKHEPTCVFCKAAWIKKSKDGSGYIQLKA
jgi:predicted nucleic acid-binding Zn finger protein